MVRWMHTESFDVQSERGDHRGNEVTEPRIEEAAFREALDASGKSGLGPDHPQTTVAAHVVVEAAPRSSTRP